eukprot:1156359-Pelagomonas_calceolata.AAC.5
MLTLVYTSSLLFLCSAGCAKLYVRDHTDQLRSVVAVVTCAESNFWDERAEETGSWLWLTKNCAKRRALMMWMASMRCACSAWTGRTRTLSNPHSLALPTHDPR